MDKSKKLFNQFIKEVSSTHRPRGKTDKAQRWSPYDIERCTCCDSIRTPSRSYPWSLYKHCCSIKHVRHLLSEHYHVNSIEDLSLLINEPEFQPFLERFLSNNLQEV